ncbi:MAG: hypothetical protein O7D91_15795 [Planctomycetota bacterium]|nr:hypothetical protein [Planctomycetota bacterium]
MKSTKTVLAVAVVIAGMASFGCGTDPSSARATLRRACANSFESDQDFEDAIAVFELARDAGLTKEQVLQATFVSGACLMDDLRLPGESIEDCTNCARALIDLVWG